MFTKQIQPVRISALSHNMDKRLKKVYSFLSKWGVVIILSLLVLEGLFLRMYSHHDFLHFQLDQARDAYLIKEAVEEGAENLPLMGPRAAGSFLRLGPIFYYFQYLSAAIFQNTEPSTLALFDLLAGVLTIPLMYLFLRMFFSKKWSLLITFLFSHSLFLLVYDRFAWNPNSLPFFSLLTFFAWLKYWKNRDENKPALGWLALTVLAGGIAVQLHFSSYLVIPLIILSSLALFFLAERFLWKKKKFIFSLKEAVVIVLVAVFTQLPVITNEIMGEGVNTRQFFETFQEKKDKDDTYNIFEKAVQNISTYSKGYWLVVMGNQDIDYPVVRMNKEGVDIRCDHFCRIYLVTTVISIVFFLISLLALTLLVVKKTKLVLSAKCSNEIKRKWRFLALSSLWLLISWWTFFTLSFSIPPRFFLLSAVVFWVMAGVLLKQMGVNRLGEKLVILLAAVIFISNVIQIVNIYDLKNGADKYSLNEYPRDLILKEAFPVTLGQEEKIVDWMEQKYVEDDNEYLLFWSSSYYYRPLRYLLDSKEETKEHNFYFSGYPTYPEASYFAVVKTSDPHKFFNDKRKPLFAVNDQKTFGTLTVYHLSLTSDGQREAFSRKDKFLAKMQVSDDSSKCLENPKPQCRFTWGDVINKLGDN